MVSASIFSCVNFYIHVLKGSQMNISRSIASIFMIQLLVASACFSGEEITRGAGDTPSSVVFSQSKFKKGKQCIILNRTSPSFERELLAVPPDACVFVVGEWMIKTDFHFKATEVSSTLEQLRVTWKNLNTPIVEGKDWTFKIKTSGIKKIVASISYNF